MTQKNRWTSRSLGSRLQHGIFYLLIRTLGRHAAYGLLFFVALWYTARPLTRSRSAAYRAHRFPASKRAAQFRHCFLLNWNFGQTLVDRATAGILGQFSISASPKDKETLLSFLAAGKGLILLTAHVGCWQTAMSGLHTMNTPVHVVMHRDPNDIDRHDFEHAGHAAPFRIIDPQGYLGGTLDMVQALNNGQILCIMGDRVFGNERTAASVSFLGQPLRVPSSPYRLASATGAPILVFFSRRIGPGRARHEIARVIHVPPGLGRSTAKITPYAQAFATALEEYIQINPYQFFNFYDMWETEQHV